ncbi:MSHA biogenesis protein MshI [Pseudomonas sp. Choline-3u-10]|jgi:MSHA biogenesis protein MshI|uniref:MSHA biogenesis protein MshI n=1 Tax=Pseudomonadaceae TaxID=135621 RepID=UPI000617B842|nr:MULTISPECIES: MSHA biogenesis protein MshI [Pseudomonadaceae]MAL37191.1 MSHA biogenesis protein MshI [Pseudomonas sp.]MBU0948710.1 MSHA biogenesis protein MshI [Gammaproteobacteria bacterium]KJJ64061.1 MSHA biogenesis protein MshI [Pseudomonas sp. 10B238]MBK3796840.1 MSHA biogenesis protein MshI [Stutzerimonas stutzeri]MBK3877343.1 MSHA biogenesis protein MshI [Stutzerimonas stutzeri]|tara:strand:- start:188 stop:1108 length:921 start_codon:yes stop_codon:yes gene_type:complete
MGLFFKRRKATAMGLLGLEFGPQGVALAQVQRADGETPQLLRCDYLEGQPEAQAELLKQAVAEHGLNGMSVNLLLHPSAYQMFLLEAPEVPAEELRDAMRWRVKDLLSEPLEDVVIDCFSLPEDAYRGRTRMVYCVVLKKSRMTEFRALVQHAGLTLASIDITEMSFRNLGLLAGADAINLALLRLRTSEGLICVQNGADLYMARRIEHGLARAEQDLSSMTLEIQRSLDYYESQLGKGYISRLLLLPMKQDGERTHQALAAGLAVNLQRLDLRELFPGQPASDLTESSQAFCIGAVGAALRQDAC